MDNVAWLEEKIHALEDARKPEKEYVLMINLVIDEFMQEYTE